jgi:hypothetical protein
MARVAADAGTWSGIWKTDEMYPGIDSTVNGGFRVPGVNFCQDAYTGTSGEIAVECATEPGSEGCVVAPMPVENNLIVEPVAAGFVALFRVPSWFSM